MRRLLAYLVLLGVILISQQSLATEKTLTIVHSNDLHSHFLGAPSNIAYSPSITGDDDTLGGFARIASVIKAVKQSRKNPVLVFDAGQIIDEGRHDELINRDGLYRDLYAHH